MAADTVSGSSSNPEPGRVVQALERIDACHREDPSGREQDHAVAVAAWVERLATDPSPALRLAARAQHIRRWTIPRDTYPRNRPGYLRWRADLAQFHADQVGAILADCGFDAAFIERVRSLMLKADLEHDAETRTLEDALCLTFMEHELAGFSTRQSAAKLRRILKRTWRKMSPAGREAAASLPLEEDVRALLERSVDC